MGKKSKKDKGLLAKIKKVNASPTLIGAAVAPFAAMALKYRLDKNRDTEKARLEEKKRNDHAKRIAKILESKKKISVTELGSGGSSKLLKRINYLRGILGVVKKNNAKGISIDGRSISHQGLKLEIGRLQRRYNSRREQRLALLNGDLDKVIEFITPAMNRRIASYIGKKYGAAKRNIKDKIRKAGKELGEGYGEGVAKKIDEKQINRIVEKAAEKAGKKFQKGSTSVKDPKAALKIAGLVGGGALLAGAGGAVGVGYGKKARKRLGMEE